MQIDLSITNITPFNKQKKFMNAVSVLQKALKLKMVTKESDGKTEHREESPFRSLREFREKIIQDADNKLFEIYKEFQRVISNRLSKAKSSVPKFNGKIVINPSTGLPFTTTQWKEIESTIDKMFRWAYADAKTAMTKKAIMLGKVLSQLSITDGIESAKDATLNALYIPDKIDPYLVNSMAYAEENAGNYITHVSDTARKKIKESIINAQRNRLSSKELERDLFDKFGAINRDFRRVAETELAYNASEGHLQTTIERSKQEGRTHTFVQGVSNGNACEFCKSEIHNHIFVLLDGPPEGDDDMVEIDGKMYMAVWPGKNNVGRKRFEWWACIPAHPHCACSFVGYTPGFEKYHDRLRKQMVPDERG